MDTQQIKQVRNAQEEIAAVRRAVKEIESFGWNANGTVEPLQKFDATLKDLEGNRANIQKLNPLDEGHKSRLSKLLEEEKYLLETLTGLARQARSALTAEELALFEVRGQYLDSFDALIRSSDETIQGALEQLLRALQVRWGEMVKKRNLSAYLETISLRHATPESFGVSPVRIGKPFPKMSHAVWPVFVGSYLARVRSIFESSETVDPVDGARAVFE